MRRLRLAILALGLLPVSPPTIAAQPLSAAVLPNSRSVQVGTAPATAFATIINSGGFPALGCSIQSLAGVPVQFTYQTTDPSTNQPVGTPNTPANISAGGAQTFVISLRPLASFPPVDVGFKFICGNTTQAPVISGVNTLLLSASPNPVLDVVALAATLGNTGTVVVPAVNTFGAFAVATVNVGAAGPVMVSADTGGTPLPVITLLCQTDTNGQCVTGVGPSLFGAMGAGSTFAFGVFAFASAPVAFNPAANRVFVRFTDAAGVVRGATSVAVRTP